MKKVQVNQQLSFSDQITLDEIESLAKDGIKVLVCNRPDGEEPGQLTAEEIAAAAALQGMQFVNIPVPGRVIPQASLDAFNQTLANTSEKIHAYCRTGTRCSIFWGLTQAQKLGVNETLNQANALGIDLSPVVDQLTAVSQENG
jgi:sulfide:quinone oxidoreductase